MKVRYATRCGRCREWINPGADAERAYGGLWHTVCLRGYLAARTASMSRAAR